MQDEGARAAAEVGISEEEVQATVGEHLRLPAVEAADKELDSALWFHCSWLAAFTAGEARMLLTCTWARPFPHCTWLLSGQGSHVSWHRCSQPLQLCLHGGPPCGCIEHSAAITHISDAECVADA